MTKQENQERIEAIKALRKLVKPGTTVYTFVKHVTSSGMGRTIQSCIVRKGELQTIDWYIHRITGWPHDRDRGGIKVSGAGMDMGFHLVYTLGRYLYPKGFKLRKGQYGRNGDSSGYDKDGGYALKQSWI